MFKDLNGTVRGNKTMQQSNKIKFLRTYYPDSNLDENTG